jgi:hypothetical protein
MDIRAGVIAAALLTVVGAILAVRAAIRAIQSARQLTFYRLRAERMASGWRLFGLSVILLGVAAWLALNGESVAYQYFPPSPTPSATPSATGIPTMTLSPTITPTPTLTDTPLATDTPTATPTPFLPIAIEAIFTSVVTPNTAAVFSQIEFSTVYDGLRAVDPHTAFQNPIQRMFGVYSYDQMSIGVQWTAIWLRNNQLICFETHPWGQNPGETTGGYGYTDCVDPVDGWRAGSYEVQIFVGTEWKVVGRFTIEGDPPTQTPTASPTFSLTPTATRTPTRTPTRTKTTTP